MREFYRLRMLPLSVVVKKYKGALLQLVSVLHSKLWQLALT